MSSNPPPNPPPKGWEDVLHELSLAAGSISAVLDGETDEEVRMNLTLAHQNVVRAKHYILKYMKKDDD